MTSMSERLQLFKEAMLRGNAQAIPCTNPLIPASCSTLEHRQ